MRREKRREIYSVPLGNKFLSGNRQSCMRSNSKKCLSTCAREDNANRKSFDLRPPSLRQSISFSYLPAPSWQRGENKNSLLNGWFLSPASFHSLPFFARENRWRARTPLMLFFISSVCMQTNGMVASRGRQEGTRDVFVPVRWMLFLSSHPFCLPQVITALFRGWNECTARRINGLGACKWTERNYYYDLMRLYENEPTVFPLSQAKLNLNRSKSVAS